MRCPKCYGNLDSGYYCHNCNEEHQPNRGTSDSTKDARDESAVNTLVIPPIEMDEIRCSDCGQPTTYKNQYDEAICKRCHRNDCETARDIKRHETKLAQRNYFGYPEMVPMPQFIEVQKGDLVKQRGEEFKAV